MTPKPPTPQGISVILAEAGCARSEVVGHGARGAGFVVAKGNAAGGSYGSAVWVQYHSNLFQDTGRRQWKLAAYAEIITSAGYSVETGEHHLIVTAGKPAEPVPPQEG